MKQKALIIGALPSPFEGPWVDISDGDVWTVKTNASISPHVMIEAEPSGDKFAAVAGELIRGQRARAIIRYDFNGVETVNVWLESI